MGVRRECVSARAQGSCGGFKSGLVGFLRMVRPGAEEGEEGRLPLLGHTLTVVTLARLWGAGLHVSVAFHMYM